MPKKRAKRHSKLHLPRFLQNIPFIYEILLAVVAFAFLFAGTILFWFATTPIPDINDFETRRVPQSTKIYDQTGTVLLYDVHGSIRRTTMPLEQISPNIQKAAIAIEDPTFYTHVGIEPKAILRAIVADIMTMHFGQGGSTITQQVVKNTILSSEKTITRKVKEWVLAIKLEQTYTKDQILNVYLNETPYGGTIYGIEEASQAFFGKPAKDITLPEAAYLAALPQAPTYFSPYGNHREALESRKNHVLDKMVENGSITEEERDEAQDTEVVFVQDGEVGIKAPHFVFYIREYLEQKYGSDAVYKDGLKVITTLDYELQKQAEDIVRTNALRNTKNFNATNAGLVAIDPNTGQIITMVGSRGYFDPEIDGKFNVTVANRQPGSSFKPFIYATAFAKGYAPETVLFNLKTQFSTVCAPEFLETTDVCYSPENYDGNYGGPLSLRDALAQSVNIPAVKLLYLVGIDTAIATAERMGITGLAEAGRYGLTLVLGGGEVKLLDMVSAYGGFATDGIRHPATGILEVSDTRGKVLEEYTESSTRVLDEQTARQMSDILSDNEARTPAFGANSSLYFPGFEVAVKTGTTNDYKDAWIVGYTPSIVVGTWAGNNDSSSMAKKVSGFIVAPMWHEFMEVIMEKYPAGQFIKPIPTDQSVPNIVKGIWNVPGHDGALHSILYWINKDNPLTGGQPSNPARDSQYSLWEYPVRLWGAFQGMGSIPSDTTPGVGTRPFMISSPLPNATIPLNTPVAITLQPGLGSTVTSVSYYLDGTFIGTVTVQPFGTTFTSTVIGSHRLEAVAQGSFGSSSETIQFITQ